MRGCACKTARVLPRDCSGAWSAATVCGGRGALWGFVADECEHVCETYPELEGSLMCHGAFTGRKRLQHHMCCWTHPRIGGH